jgi:hypothetical protein
MQRSKQRTNYFKELHHRNPQATTTRKFKVALNSNETTDKAEYALQPKKRKTPKNQKGTGANK